MLPSKPTALEIRAFQINLNERHTMATGTIKTLQRDRGFGFITPSSGQAGSGDIFFHSSAVENRLFDELVGGEQVSFEMEADPRNPSRSRAANVQVVSSDN